MKQLQNQILFGFITTGLLIAAYSDIIHGIETPQYRTIALIVFSSLFGWYSAK